MVQWPMKLCKVHVPSNACLVVVLDSGSMKANQSQKTFCICEAASSCQPIIQRKVEFLPLLNQDWDLREVCCATGLAGLRKVCCRRLEARTEPVRTYGRRVVAAGSVTRPSARLSNVRPEAAPLGAGG